MLMNSEPAYKVDDNTQNQARKKVEIFNTGHAMRIFAESTYTRPKEAVVRETIANAMDASRGTQFEVTAPSLLDPNFKVRDYGVGMDEDFFLNEYAKVGYSTKRASNDEVGGFGQGRFAAFAYKPCDQFYVRGYKDGKTFLGSVWHDADFEIFVQVESRGDTDQPNGVEVTIPVQVADHKEFFAAIQIFTEFVPTAKTGLPPLTRPTLFEGKDKSWKISSFEYVSPTNNSSPVRAVMGGVPYKLDLSQVFRYDTKGYLNVTQADLIFPIGALAIPASREELRYDEPTKAAIIAKFAEIKKELVAEVAERQKSFTTDFERWTDPTVGAYEAALGHELKKTIEANTIPGVEFIQDFSRIREFEGRSRVTAPRVEFTPKRNYLVYVIDTPKWRQRLGAHATAAIAALDAAKGGKASGVVITLQNDTGIALKLGNVPYVKTSTIPEPPKIPRVKVALPPGQAPVSVARTPKTGVWNQRTYRWDFKDGDFTQKSVVYVPMKITQVKDDYNSLWDMIKTAKEATAYVGVPEADIKLAQAAGWTPLKTHLRNLLMANETLEGLAYERGWPGFHSWNERQLREQLRELLRLTADGFKLPQGNSELQKKLEIFNKAMSTSDDDLKSHYTQILDLADFKDIVVPTSNPKYRVKDEFIAFLKSKPVFAVLLEQEVFSAMTKAKVDVPTIIAYAKKAL